MSLRRSDEDLVIDSHSSQSSAPVPTNNDDWSKEVIAELNSLISSDGSMKPAPESLTWWSTHLPQKDDFCFKMKPTSLGEGGKSALALYSKQIAQQVPRGEEESKPLCEESGPCFRLPVSPSCDKQEPTSCGICDGPHHHSDCDLRTICPTDKTVGNGFMIICLCGNFLINGRCPHGCPPKGAVIRDLKFYQTPLVSELFSTKSNKYI